jgi:hypothetical protein
MASTVAALPERITALLLNEGIVSRELLERAQRDAKQNGTTVTLALIRTGAIEEVELTKIIARTYRMPAVDLSKFEVDPRILRLVPSDSPRATRRLCSSATAARSRWPWRIRRTNPRGPQVRHPLRHLPGAGRRVHAAQRHRKGVRFGRHCDGLPPQGHRG